MKKKPLLITAYALAIAIVVGIIVLAVVPVSTFPQINNPTAEIEIQYETDASSKLVYTTEDDNYNKVLKEIKKGFSVNFLTGLFNGYLSSTEKDPVPQTAKPPVVYVTFNYLQPQTLKVNGKLQNKSSNSAEKLTYTTLSFGISEANAGSLVSVYFTTNDEDYSKYVVKYYANLSNVYELIQELKP